MKKTLALVLALVMVLALVPVAFAATTTISNSDYKVVATITPTTTLTQINDPAFKWAPEATGSKPAVEIALPYKLIGTQDTSSSIWSSSTDLNIKLNLRNLGGNSAIFSTDGTLDKQFIDKIKINGTEYAPDDSKISLTANNGIEFNMGGVSSLSNTYEYVVELFGKASTKSADYYEKAAFTVKFVNSDKSAYDLKVVSIEGAEKKDGVWFFDTDQATVASLTAQDITVAKNDGSKIDGAAYYTIKKDDYDAFPSNKAELKALDGTVIKDINITSILGGSPAADTKYTLAIRVETQYAQYQTKIDLKLRTNVVAVDPKGVNFGKDEYTIAVNEVLFPTYSYVVSPLKDLASAINLEQTAYGEKNIIDIDKDRTDNKDAIIGLKEGTAYVKLTYTFTDGKIYTDTAKVTVKSANTVLPDDNFVVTTASGSCLYKRAAASKSAAILGKLQNGTVIQVAEIKDGWAKCIDSSNYSNYYVSAAYITRQGTLPTTGTGTGIVVARKLNVRAGAGTSYAVAGHLYHNAKVEIVEKVGDGSWAKIKYNNGTAYVSMKYIA